VVFSETNDNSVAIPLTYGTTRVLLADDAAAKKSTWRAVHARGLRRSLGFRSTNPLELKFSAFLTEGAYNLVLL
jgi:hypothetical protein